VNSDATPRPLAETRSSAPSSMWSELMLGWWATLSHPGRRVLWLVLGVNACLTVYTAVGTLQRFPNAGDEYAYLISAELFSTGRIAAPSPIRGYFFDFSHVVNDGRFYGKYPPGWPALLVFGVMVGAPWIVNPILGMLTIVVIYELSARHLSREAANLAVLYLACNPFLVFTSASHLSHTSCLLEISLCYYCFFNWLDNPESKKDALGLGACAGMAFLTRPLTMVALLAPLGLYVLFLLVRDKPRRALWGRNLALSFIPAGLCLGIFFLYNRLQTGDALLQPFVKYNSQDTPHLPQSFGQYAGWVNQFVLKRLLDLSIWWLPLGVPMLGFLAFRKELRSDRKAMTLLASFLGLVMVYSLYPYDGGVQYGPRYIYETLTAVAVLCGLGMGLLPRASLLLLATVVVMNVVGMSAETSLVAPDIRGKMDLYHLAEDKKLTNALIFLRTGSGTASPLDLTRNGTRFDGPILFVRDFGKKNADLLREFPERSAYYYDYDPIRKKGRLTVLSR